MAYVVLGAGAEQVSLAVDSLVQIKVAQGLMRRMGIEVAEVYAGIPECGESFKRGDVLQAFDQPVAKGA